MIGSWFKNCRNLGRTEECASQPAGNAGAHFIAEAKLKEKIHAMFDRTVPKAQLRQMAVAGGLGPQPLKLAPSLHHFLGIR